MIENYDLIINEIKENLHFISEYTICMEESKESIIRKYYHDTIEKLKKENIKLEKILNNRKTNPNRS